MDPQGNATSGLGIDRQAIEQSMYEVLVDRAPLESAIISRLHFPFLDLAPSDQDLVGAEVQLVQQREREKLLRRSLSDVREKYDYILVDCPPSLGLLTLNTLAAADSVLIPIQCEFYALQGLTQLLSTVTVVQQSLNPRLQIEGVLLTMYDQRLNLSRQVAEEAKEYFGKKVYKVTIPRNVRLAEAPSFGKPIVVYDILSAGAQSYLSLAQEVIGRTTHIEAPQGAASS
jgi:chromosome partitioning protein